MSLKVALEYIGRAKLAYKRSGFPSQQRLAEALGIHRETVSKFLNGKPISYLNFEEICQKLGLDLEEIADFGTQEDESSEPPVRIDSLQERLLGYAGLSDTQSTPDEVEPISAQTSPFLFEQILQIDFREQSRLFKQVIQSHRTAGFLIHGEPCCGQQFLVNRLLRLKRGWQNHSPIKIDVSYSGVGRSIPNLWRELTPWFSLPRDARPSEIMDRVCDRWQTQDVIFIFYTVDYMLPGMLSAWLQEFWEPLVARATENMPKCETHLLMFLVDYCGSVCQTSVRLAEQCEHPEYPRLPLCLPPASPFPLDALDEWIDNLSISSQVQIPAGLTSRILLERSSNGVPQFVYEEICKHCGLSWEGVLAKWLD
ncbi:helix-turn-helix domain-containing protein [Trichocoleus sp. DQ-U1]|uniref:helix-turn-helix domain-containing protein n=1 Tax=Trichocoleus sp. DQ-U1 TaxID=2933926 RepID=UPI0032978B9E